ncbi:hypothetical protein V1280_003435 [Bradyrhizobium sp. AZCC 2230]
MTILVVRPNHCTASAIRSIHDSILRNINPLAINAHAITTIPTFPIGIVYSHSLTPITAWPFAAMQALIPTVQLRVLRIMSMRAIDCKDRHSNRKNKERCFV